jgi:hypothetical protein
VQESLTYYPRNIIARVVFLWLFIILVYFFHCNTLLSQLHQPVFIYSGSDNSFWLVHLLYIPQFFLQHYWAALLFDITLTTSCLICIFLPTNKLFTYLTIIGIWLLHFCYSSAAGKQYAQIGYLITPTALLFFNPTKFAFSWQLVRYWVCFLYGSAGLYKIINGGFSHPLNMSNILQQMNAEWLYFNPTGFQSTSIFYLINHPFLSQLFFIVATLVDLSCIIGFFTKKYDQYLVGMLILFHLGNYFLLHISFIEQSLIFAPFFAWHKIATHIYTNYHNDRPITL